jgi:1,4-alpha-glucan branching enzyme
MSDGYLCLVLHAHLPFVRHAEHEDFLEEDWLFEAITEAYVPLWSSLLGLRDQGVPFRLTLSVSPTLAAMLDDGLLRARYRRALGKLTELADAEVRGNPETTPVGRAARHYLDRFRFIAGFLDRFGDDLLAPVRELQNSGFVEVIACNGTHGFLPLMSSTAARRAQIRAGVQAYKRSFGRRPKGMWLAECGFDHGTPELLAEEKLDFFFVDSRALHHGRPRPRAGVFAPVRTPAGPAAFGRDEETSRQVWSAQEGYPGDPVYREFYRDLGWDADYAYIRPYLHADGVRRGVGIKYHRVTGAVSLQDKQPWDPAIAEARAREHAAAFVAERRQQCARLRHGLDRPPLVVSPYDAELFGHWWYEGPTFLTEVLRLCAGPEGPETVTASQVLARHGELQVQRPSPSSWGVESTNKVWLSAENAWLYRYQHWAEGEMNALVRRFGGEGGLVARALRQAGRELLLLQSSDWAFILTTGTSPPYAARRAKQHFENFQRLRDQLVSQNVRENEVSALEAATPIFPDLDVSAWS